MSDSTSTAILEERLRLGAGFSDRDWDRVLEILSPLGRHLSHWSPEQVDVEVSVKNRGGLDQKVTIEAWLPRWPSMVASATDRELDHALVVARKDMIRRVEDEKAKREPGPPRAPRPGRD